MVGIFTPDEVWFGGDYELGVELGARNDGVLLAALKSVF